MKVDERDKKKEMNFLHWSMVTFYLLHFTESLECGFSVGSSNNEIKKLADSCTNVINKDVDEKNSTNSTLNTTNYDRNNSTDDKDILNGLRRSRRNTTSSDNKTESDDNSKSVQDYANDAADIERCVVQCIFDKLQMTDDKGYPDYKKVSEGLLQKAGGRELRDFLQDSADTCFQHLKRNGVDACQYSIELVGCLAEKGKLNCADWPVGELPFKMYNDTNQMN